MNQNPDPDPHAGANPSRCGARRSDFGLLPDGGQVSAITLANGNGLSITVISYGATLQSVVLPSVAGDHAEVTLGHDTLSPYLETPQYFGSTVGRFANRIAGGRFTLSGAAHQIPPNDDRNALHGGPRGLDKVLWDIVAVREEPDRAVVTLRHVSFDGDQGFPGNLTVTASYSLDDRDRLKIEYRATTDRLTVVNLTNHAYWNLAGDGASDGAMGHVLSIPAEYYLPIDQTLIPTGERRSVAGTPFDFRKPVVVGKRVREAGDEQIGFARGYDHNWIIADHRTDGLNLAARLEDPGSGRSFELWSNQPGVQFYSGNFLDGTTIGRSGRLYRQGDAIALEPQLFPDSVNRPDFPSTELSPGDEYLNVMEYRFFQSGGRDGRRAED